ncbi:MAG: hypothetical protein HRT88_22495 [Lentisphaeraceae bacterium]|nr:hypothetical protein [Lentisphaeraceae bacterium]
MDNVLYALVVIGLFFPFLAIRVILKKDKSFRGSCGSMNITGDGSGTCSICGRTEDEVCGSEDLPSDAMKAAIAAESGT